MYLLGRPSAGEVDEATGEVSAELVCPQCPLVRTKPGSESLRVAIAKVFAQEHEEEVNSGLRLSSVDALTPMEWAAVRGLSRGRARFDEYKYEQMKAESEAARPPK